MRNVSWYLLLFFATAGAFGQTKVNGKLTTPDGQPIPFANVLLLSSADSSLVKGTLTDAQGAYQLADLRQGHYLLRFSSMGYQTWNTPAFELSGTPAGRDFGSQVLAADVTQLEAVEVRGQKPLYQQEIDRTIINVQSSPLTKGSSVLEVLERSPGIVHDRQNSNLILNGKRGVGVMINGKLLQMSAAEVTSLLNGMNADNIEKIEILTTPPAKYDAEGVGGLINIVVKRNEEDGTNGSVSLSGGYGLYAKGVASANVNHRKGGFNLYGNYALTYDKTTMDLLARGAFRFPHESPETNRVSDYISTRTPAKWMHNATIGFDYALDKKTIIGASSIGSMTFQESVGFTDAKYTIFGDSLQRFLVDIYEKNNWKSSINNLNLERVVGKEGKLTVDLNYLYYVNENPSSYKNYFLDKAGNPITGAGFLSDQQVNNQTPIHIFVYKLDYEKRLSPAVRIEAGIKSSGLGMDNAVDVQDTETGALQYNPELSYRLKMQEDIRAAYSSVDLDFDKTKVNLGLRYELTHTDVDYKTPGKTGFTRRYGNAFPSVFVTRKVTGNATAQLSYNRRITRPAFTAIASPVTFNDIYSIRLGNPLLRPTISDNLKGQFQYKEYLFSLQVNKDKNQIIEFQSIRSPSDSIIYSTSLNLKSQESVWFQAALPVRFTARWQMQNSIQVGWKQFEAQGIVEENFTKSLYLLNLYSSHSLQLGPGLFMEVSGYYYSPDYNGAFKRLGFGALNAGVKKDLQNNRGTVQLSFPDLLMTTHYPFYIEPGLAPYELTSRIDARPESRKAFVVKVAYSKSFGSNKIKSQRQRREASGDERERLR